MKSLQRAFLNHSQQSPNHSSYICFRRAVAGKRLTRRSIGYWFDQLVDREDYARKDRNVLVSDLHSASQQVLSQKCALSKKKQANVESVESSNSEGLKRKKGQKCAALEGFSLTPSFIVCAIPTSR